MSSEDEFISDTLPYDVQPVPYAQIASRISWALVGFGAVHFLSTAVWKRVLGKRLQTFSYKNQLYFPERICSSVHGLYVGLYSLWVVLGRRAYATDAIYAYPPEADKFFSVMVAYQVYDMILMYLQGEPASLWLHHVLTLAGSLFIQIYRVAGFAPTMFAISELTVLAVNFDWYLQKLGYERSSWACTMSNRWILVMYLLFRLPIGPLTIGWIAYLRQFDRIPNIPKVVSILSTFNVLTLTYLNYSWTRRLLRRFTRATAPLRKGA